MNNSIMLPIRPKWCAKEYTGEKKGELRKGWFIGCEGKKFYIYCTSVKAMSLKDYCEAHMATGGAIDNWSGKVIGEFVCERIDRFTAEFVDEKKHGLCYEDIRMILPDDYDNLDHENYRIITSNEEDDPSDCDLCRDTCLSFEDIKAYIGENFHEKKFCYINFSNLIFYDEPKDLSEFIKIGAKSIDDFEDESLCAYCKRTDRGENACYGTPNGPVFCEAAFCDEAYETYLDEENFILTRPPQSWCYVRERDRNGG